MTTTSPSEIDQTLQRSSRGVLEPIRPLALPVLGGLLILLIWEMWVRIGQIPEFLLAKPSDVVVVLIEDFDMFLPHIWVTTQEILLGTVVAIVVAIPLAIAIASSKLIEETLFPLVVASQLVPKVAIAPIFVVWLGFDLAPKVLVTALIAFFPLALNTVVGLKSLELEKVYLAQSMGITGFRSFLRFRMPNALPVVFTGLKVAVTLAVVGAIVGEFIAANQGLGRLLIIASGRNQTDVLFAGVAILTVIGLILYGLVDIAERISIPWHVSHRKRS